MGRHKKEEIKEKSTKLDNALSQLEKQFGKGIITNLSDGEVLNIDRISTGSEVLDQALGGGMPRGRIVEAFGAESSGKTSLGLSLIAEVQKMGLRAAFIDAEHALDKEYAKLIGVNLDELIFCQPDYGEQALEVVEKVVETGEVALVVVDSVAALTPKAEIEGEMGSSHMGLQARLMSQAMRKLNAIISKTNTIVYFTNQTRKNIGVMFGSPNTTTGGNALKFYASIRLDMARTGKIKKGEEVLASEVKVKVVKNKVAAPYKEAKIEIYFDEGISKISDLINIGFDTGILSKSGAWIYFGEEKFQGMETLRDYLKSSKENQDKVRKEIQEFLKAKQS